MLGGDVVHLMDALSIERAHFVGASLGGFIGQWLGSCARDRVDHLVLVNTAPRIGPPAGWDARIAEVREQGISAVVDPSIQRWFTPAFVSREPAVVDSVRAMLLATSAEGYIGCCAAIRDLDLRPLAPTIDAPTLVIAGSADFATPVADAEWLANHIPNAAYATLDAAHMANLEAAPEFTAAIVGFLSNAGE
jgi:3-oxoadipate enol-lactonase